MTKVYTAYKKLALYTLGLAALVAIVVTTTEDLWFTLTIGVLLFGILFYIPFRDYRVIITESDLTFSRLGTKAYPISFKEIQKIELEEITQAPRVAVAKQFIYLYTQDAQYRICPVMLEPGTLTQDLERIAKKNKIPLTKHQREFSGTRRK